MLFLSVAIEQAQGRAQAANVANEPIRFVVQGLVAAGIVALGTFSDYC